MKQPDFAFTTAPFQIDVLPSNGGGPSSGPGLGELAGYEANRSEVGSVFEEYIQGNLAVHPTLVRRREFFRAMAESEFLQRKPVQNRASAYEKQVEIVIGRDRCKFWEFELLHQPVVARGTPIN